MPLRSTFFSWWKVARFAPAWITKPHWNNSKKFGVIKFFFTYIQPTSQVISTLIIPRNTTFVYFYAWGLANEYYFTFFVSNKNGITPQRKVLFAYLTFFYFFF